MSKHRSLLCVLSLCLFVAVAGGCAVSPDYPQEASKLKTKANLAQSVAEKELVSPVKSEPSQLSRVVGEPTSPSDICVGEWCSCDAR